MASKRPHPRRKRRTRAHVIAELSANHVERQVLLCGFSVERIEHDYGIDLVLFTYDGNGEVENGQVFLQLKATDKLKVQADRSTISFRVERADLEWWLKEPMPVILVVYDALSEIAYWLYIQAYFEERGKTDPSKLGGSQTVHLPRANVLDQGAVRQFARYRDAVLAQTKEVIHRHA